MNNINNLVKRIDNKDKVIYLINQINKKEKLNDDDKLLLNMLNNKLNSFVFN